MSAAEFSLLPQDLQSDLLYSDGVYIGKRKVLGRICLLFQYETFYVEVVYESYRGQIHSVVCYSSTACLDPYLSQVNAAELMD